MTPPKVPAEIVEAVMGALIAASNEPDIREVARDVIFALPPAAIAVLTGKAVAVRVEDIARLTSELISLRELNKIAEQKGQQDAKSAMRIALGLNS